MAIGERFYSLMHKLFTLAYVCAMKDMCMMDYVFMLFFLFSALISLNGYAY